MTQVEEPMIVATNSFDSTVVAIREYFWIRARNGYTRRMKIHREQKHLLEFFTIPKSNILLFGKKRPTAKTKADDEEMMRLQNLANTLFEELSICKEESSLLSDKRPKQIFIQVTDECGGWSETHGGSFNVRKPYWNTHKLEKDQIIEESNTSNISAVDSKKKRFFSRIFTKWW